MKVLYRLRVWTYEMAEDVPEVFFFAFNDQDAERQMKILVKAYPPLMMVHLERLSWDSVFRHDTEPRGLAPRLGPSHKGG